MKKVATRTVEQIDAEIAKLNDERRKLLEDRHALAEHLEEALANAKGLEAAASNDPQQASISGLDLRQSLHELWKLRHVRTNDWSTILNKLQVVTSKVEFEKFNPDMAMAVRMVIESHLRPDVDNNDVRAATILLERADAVARREN